MNCRPRGYESRALTNWATLPTSAAKLCHVLQKQDKFFVNLDEWSSMLKTICELKLNLTLLSRLFRIFCSVSVI